MRYKSLNESILSVTNPQPEFTQEDLLEDVQTKERAKETKGMSHAAWKRTQDTERKADSAVEAARDIMNRTAKGDAGHRKALKTTLGAENKARDKYDSIRSLIGKEKRSKDMFGKGGKIIKKATVKEEQEYIAMLEFALEAIAEELECSVEELIEKADYSKVHYGLPIPKGRIDYLTRAEKAKGRLGGLKGKGKYRTSIADPKNKMGT